MDAIAKMPLETGLREEREALTEALRIRSLLDRADSDEISLIQSGVVTALITYLREDLEAHFREEEAFVFPRLLRRGFGHEVIEAVHQHDEVRALRDALDAAVGQGAADGLREKLRKLANALAEHVRFEADLLYFGATDEELAAFRADLDAYYAECHRPSIPKTETNARVNGPGGR